MKYFLPLLSFLFLATVVSAAQSSQLTLSAPTQVDSGQDWTVLSTLNHLPPAGIIGLRLVYNIDSKLKINPDAVEVTLPSSWTVVHKIVNADQIVVEAAYVHPGVTGFTNSSPTDIAHLHFKTSSYGTAHITLDAASSQILAKSGNRNILDSGNFDQTVEINPTGLQKLYVTLLHWLRIK